MTLDTRVRHPTHWSARDVLRRRPGMVAWDVFKFVAVILAIAWSLHAGAARLGYHWQWYRMPAYLFGTDAEAWFAAPLIRGLGVTMAISATGWIFMIAVGLVAALARLGTSHVAGASARLYVEAIRNTPLLTLLFFIYFVVAPGTGLDAWWSAVIALALFEGAYTAEIFRAGILAVDAGQWEAGKSIGLRPWDLYRQVILPQAVARILTPLTNQSVSLVKDSALVSAIAVYDLAMQGQVIVSETFLVFETWLTVAAIYLAVTTTIAMATDGLSQRRLLIRHP